MSSIFRIVRLAFALAFAAILVLVSGGTTSSPTNAAFPGNNGKIAYAGFNLNGAGEIYVANNDGTGRVNITNDDDAYDTEPRWSPDGSKIAFVSDRSGNNDVYAMNANGSGVVNLSQNPADDRSPAWSPDGLKIAFTTNRDGNDEIYVMNSGNGSGQTNLTNFMAHDADPAWSPDGTQIAFSFGNFGQRDIAVMPADGSDSLNITNTSGVDDYDPSWSPNGASIAYTRHNGGGNYEIYLMNASGSSQTNITNQAAADQGAAWSPDGQEIAFSSDLDGNIDVFLMYTDGSGLLNITSVYDQPINVSPDWESLPCGALALSAAPGPLDAVCTIGDIVVNSKADTPDANAGDNKCYTGQQIGGKDECTLRAAIKHANDKAGEDEITFNLSGNPKLIPVFGTDLPDITDPVTIDGGGPIDQVFIGKAGTDRTGTGLTVNTINSTIREVSVTNFAVGVAITSGPGNVVLGSNFFDNNEGIELYGANGNTIGGHAQLFDLNFFRNNDVGLRLFNSDNNQVPRNTFGIDEGNPAPNEIGIEIVDSADNVIGEAVEIGGNTIAYSAKVGILIHGFDSHGNIIQGNGVTDNAGIGIGINTHVVSPAVAYGNVIGGADDKRNAISRNAGDGIRIGISASNDTGNLISSNLFYENGGLGINLGEDGVTPNDTGNGDADHGGNHLQNYPVLTAAWNDGSDLKVTGTLDSAPNQTFQVDLYVTTPYEGGRCDPSTHGEGEFFIASQTVVTDGSGKVAFEILDAFGHQPDGGIITATASRFIVPGDPATLSDTSEFSRCVAVQPSTKLAEPAAAGASTVQVDFSAPFAGDPLRDILISVNAFNEEMKKILPASPRTSGATVLGTATTLVLDSPLQFDHAAGEPVVLVQWEETKGDVDCSGAVNSVDALKVLRHSAGLSVAQTAPCPPVSGSPHLGDTNCSATINAIDALLLLRFGAGLSLSLPVGCGPPGSLAIG